MEKIVLEQLYTKASNIVKYKAICIHRRFRTQWRMTVAYWPCRLGLEQTPEKMVVPWRTGDGLDP
nr:hypothetical protein Iba_chr04eCG17530 [Ipomoea batatas]